MARDAAGNSTTSAGVTVTVSNDTTAPTVWVTAPADAETSGLDPCPRPRRITWPWSACSSSSTAPTSAPKTRARPTGTWNTATATNGPHTLTAVARDAAGNRRPPRPSRHRRQRCDGAGGVVTAPANGATVQATIDVSADASDNVAVSGVQFKLDGANLGSEDTSTPYTLTWDTSTATNGSHALTAVARDAAGNPRPRPHHRDGLTRMRRPTVSLTAPAEARGLARSRDGDRGGQRRRGRRAVQTRRRQTSAPRTPPPPTASRGTRPTAANGPTRSPPWHATPPVTPRPPAVNVTVTTTHEPDGPITAPADGATVGARSRDRDAADNVGVSGVQFKLDGANLAAEDTSSPYSLTWDTTKATNGPHTLTAVAATPPATRRPPRPST